MKQAGEQIDDNEAQQNDRDNSQHAAILPQEHSRIAKRFRPHPVLTIAAIILVALFSMLAAWQFDRAEQKASLEDAARMALAASPTPLKKGVTLRPFMRVEARGTYLPSMQILIDNRVQDKTPGMHVITPLLLEDGSAVAVNRGWIQTGKAAPLAPAGAVTVQGVMQKDGSDAFTLSSDTEAGNVWQNLHLRRYAALHNLPLISLVLFAREGGGGLPPAIVRTDFKSAQSDAYAWQWITFCALALAFYVILGFKKTPVTEEKRGAKRSRMPLFAILAIGIATPLLSTAAFHFYPPNAITANGDILPPSRTPGSWRLTGDRWTLLYAGPADCGDSCRKRLCQMRQLRLMLPGDYLKLRRAWLANAVPSGLRHSADCGEDHAAEFAATAPDVDIGIGVDAVPGNAGALPAPAPGRSRSDYLYLVDPEGVFAMRFPPDMGIREIRADLAKLLKADRKTRRAAGN